MRGFSRFYPTGPAVGHLVGYVGAASAKEYEKEKNPLLITPGFKIGKEGLEKTLGNQACAVSPAGSGSNSLRAASWSANWSPSPTARARPSS